MTKILIRDSDSAVIYAQDDLTLNANALRGDGWRDPNFTTSNSTLEDATLVAYWRSGKFTYVGGIWTVLDQADQDLYEAAVLQGQKSLYNRPIRGQIKALEVEYLMPRQFRDFMLKNMEAEFTAPQLAQKNYYVVVKNLDDQIAALRAQLI